MMSAETDLQVRFKISHKVEGPLLAYCVAPLSNPASEAGVLFDSVAKLEERLNLAGLPGREIASMRNPTTIYSVSVNQLGILGFKNLP
jgi:hypothetical protein